MGKILEDFTNSIVFFNKPLFGIVHGRVTGFTFTMLAHFDFVFASEDAIFQAPFIRIMQTP